MNDKELPVIDQLLDELQSAGVFATALLNNVHDFHHYKEKARPIIAKYLAPSVALDKLDSSSPVGDRNVESVISKHRLRAEVGLKKYGVTTERGDLTDAQWLQHLQEELLDAAVYVEALLAGQLDTSLTEAIRGILSKWRSDLAKIEGRLSSAYTGDANAAEERRLEECIAELEQLLSQAGRSAGMGWQDISTAPKDGTGFLGYWDDPDDLHVVCIRDGQCYREMDRDAWAMPTLWQSLPSPPVQEQSRG